jgi:hypothetical protein
MKTRTWATLFEKEIPTLLLWAAALTYLAARVVILNSHHWDIGGIENSVVFSTAKALYGLPLYGDPESANFDITQYSPLYYHFFIGLARLLRIDPMEDLQSLYLLGRYLSLSFNLTGAWVVFRMLTHLFNVDRRAAVPASILSFLTLSDFHFAARPDSLFFLTGTLTVYFLSGYMIETRESQGRFQLSLAILAAAISVFAKQTGIQYLIFIPLFFLSQRMYKQAMVSGLSLVAATVALFLFFRQVHGPYFDKNVIGGLNNGTSPVFAANLLSMFLLHNQVLVTLGILAVAQTLINREEPRSTRLLSILSLWLFVFAVGTSLKKGSWLNYYTDFLNAFIVVTAIRLDRLSRHAWREDSVNKFLKWSVAVCLAVYLPGLFIQTLGPKLKQHFPRAGRAYAQSVERKRPAAEYLRSNLREGQYLLAFDRHVEQMLADKTAMPNKDIIPEKVNYDYKGFYNSIENGTIRYFLLGKSALGERFMGIDYSRFPRVYEDETFVILENVK